MPRSENVETTRFAVVAARAGSAVRPAVPPTRARTAAIIAATEHSHRRTDPARNRTHDLFNELRDHFRDGVTAISPPIA